MKLIYLSWSKSSSVLDRIWFVWEKLVVEDKLWFDIGRGIFVFIFNGRISAIDDDGEYSLAVVVTVDDDVADNILIGILDIDFFRFVWCVDGGDGECSAFCFINDAWLFNGINESHELARRVGLLIKRCRLDVLARSCWRKCGQDGSWWWFGLAGGLGKSFNDSHLHAKQRGHKGTGVDCCPCNNGSHQSRSVPAKSVCSFDTVVNKLVSLLFVNSDIDADRLVNRVVAALQPRKKLYVYYWLSIVHLKESEQWRK